MVKGLIITHGNLGRELVDVAERILEEKTDIESISFDWTGDGSETRRAIESFLKQHSGDHVIIFTDMFGGSPCNISTRYLNSKVEVISGVNLAGLLKYISIRARRMPFADLVKAISQETKDGITILSEYLGEKK
jgi:mannose PTS system EIIA component